MTKEFNDAQSFFYMMVRVSKPEEEGYQYYIQMFSDGKSVMAFHDEATALRFVEVPKDMVHLQEVKEFYNRFKPVICYAENLEELRGLLVDNPIGAKLELWFSNRKSVLTLCKPDAEAVWLDGRVYNIGEKI